MKFVLQKKIFLFSLSLFLSFGFFFFVVKTTQAASDLRGRILLQVEEQGRAWYVYPPSNKRFYLGRPEDAFNLMRSLGLGASNKDINNFLSNGAPARLKGFILLQVEDKGQAYYVDPLDLKLYYLSRPKDAFNLMHTKALGIKNTDLYLIEEAILNIEKTDNLENASNYWQKFSFKYKNENYELIQSFSDELYNSYKNSPKIYTYYSSNPPTDLRDAFYSLFFSFKKEDYLIKELVANLRKLAVEKNFTEDEFLEFSLALVQYIPYANDKVVDSSLTNNNPYFPYETLYLNKGVCSDKTFLGVAILRELGYGAAILDFPEINHSALGLACLKEQSFNFSGYCYVEMTNYFPPGIVPQTISGGQAQSNNSIGDYFSGQKLGKMEIYQKSSGKFYQGIPALINKINLLQTSYQNLKTKESIVSNLEGVLSQKEEELALVKKDLDYYYSVGSTREYNELALEYNILADEYNSILVDYKSNIENYNLLVQTFNSLSKELYQR